MKAELDDLRGDVRTELDDLRGDVRSLTEDLSVVADEGKKSAKQLETQKIRLLRVEEHVNLSADPTG